MTPNSRITPYLQPMVIDHLACLTPDMPGIAGQIKTHPQDFIVHEIPLYQPSGNGQHLYLLVEKTLRTTTDVARILAQHFAIPIKTVGYAGLKDKYAVTRQAFSLEVPDNTDVTTFHDGHIKIISADRHTNKIKRGHLAGNRFVIKVRNTNTDHILHARDILDHLVKYGAPNYLGEQRFGYRHNNHILGKYLLCNDYQSFLDELLGHPLPTEIDRNQKARNAYDNKLYNDALNIWPTVHRAERQALGPLSRGASPKAAITNIDITQRKIYISAFQSYIFNHLCNQRIANNLLHTLILNDIAFKHDSRACFDVTHPTDDQPRCDNLEISPSGPMWGAKMKRASGDIGQNELQALTNTGVTENGLNSSYYKPSGARRPYRIPITNPDIVASADERGPFIQLAFDLPRGSFATIIMREIMKTPDSITTSYNNT